MPKRPHFRLTYISQDTIREYALSTQAAARMNRAAFLALLVEMVKVANKLERERKDNA